MVVTLDKNFNEFLNTIDDEEIIHNAPKYISKSSFIDESEKYLHFSIAISKTMLEKYHQWLNS